MGPELAHGYIRCSGGAPKLRLLHTDACPPRELHSDRIWSDTVEADLLQAFLALNVLKETKLPWSTGLMFLKIPAKKIGKKGNKQSIARERNRRLCTVPAYS